MDKRLRQFLAVAETGNVSVAAELLHVTQPTISVNLNKLEEDQLFSREDLAKDKQRFYLLQKKRMHRDKLEIRGSSKETSENCIL